MPLEPHRAEDVLILQHLFGVKKIHYNSRDTKQEFPQYIPSGKPWRTHQIDAEPVPAWGRSIGEAWLLVDQMNARGWLINLASSSDGQTWVCNFEHDTRDLELEGVETTAAMAIRAAILRAIRQMVYLYA